MKVEHHKANLGNLGEEFLENDPQQTDDNSRSFSEQDRLRDALDREDDEDGNASLNYPGNYSDDVTLGTDIDKTGPMDTEFLIPAPSQMLNADEEPGGMYGSTADELIGSPGPDEQDLGTLEGDNSRIMRNFNHANSDDALVSDRTEDEQFVEIQGGRDVRGSAGMEDILSTDLPIGGTADGPEEIIDEETGELTDYDDDKQEALT